MEAEGKSEQASPAFAYRELQKEILLQGPLVIERIPAGLKVYAVGGLKNVEPGSTATLRKGQAAVNITVSKDNSRIELTPLTETPTVLCDRDGDSNKFFVGLKIKR